MGLFNHFPYPDTHQLNLDWILDAVKTCVDKVTELWTYVSEHGGSIQQALTDAQTAATTAQTSAQSAQTSAQSAQTEATTAQTSAHSAQTAATTAQTSAQSAQESAQSAQESAQSAQASVTELAALFFDNAGAHNSIYRGKNLGTSVTAAQWEAIANGSFTDLYIGDYWAIGGVTYRIAAFDYYLRTGDTDLTTHHVTLVPDASMYNHVMNDTNVTTGGYVGSKMYNTGLANAKTTIYNAFGSAHILTHRQYLCNAVSNGKPSSCSWYDSNVELMTEHNVYGGKVFGAGNDGSSVPALYSVDKSQYPLFAFRPDLISNRTWFWLRDVVSTARFADVDSSGYTLYSNASYSGGVRPAFSIKS